MKKKGAKIGRSFPDFWVFSYDWVEPFISLFLSMPTLHYMFGPITT